MIPDVHGRYMFVRIMFLHLVIKQQKFCSYLTVIVILTSGLKLQFLWKDQWQSRGFYEKIQGKLYDF